MHCSSGLFVHYQCEFIFLFASVAKDKFCSVICFVKESTFDRHCDNPFLFYPTFPFHLLVLSQGDSLSSVILSKDSWLNISSPVLFFTGYDSLGEWHVVYVFVETSWL
jgi:hypothetical protein